MVKKVGFFAGPFARRTWSEFLFLFVGVFTAGFGLAYSLAAVSVSAGLIPTVVGFLFVGGGLIVGGRAWGGLYRAMGRGLLGIDVAPPRPFRRGRGGGFWRTGLRMVGDVPGWRGLAFGVVSFVTIVGGFVVSIAFLATGLGGLTYPYWYRFLPLQQAPDLTWHRGNNFGTSYFIDTPARIWTQALVCLFVLFLWPYVTRGVVHVTRLLIVNLLGPTRSSLRVADLERSRGQAVLDADARLRRIERDLHDGTQARLVAVAMQLGEAKEQLASDAGAPDALGLVSRAHESTKEAIVELREIARGIHPPVLDGGLAAALETLAARSPVRTVVDAEPGVRADPAIETLAYFAVSELVTNAARHAHASTVWVLVEPVGNALRVRVRDDGVGGARVNLNPSGPGGGSGLGGLVERVRAVDGTLDLASEPGAGTRVEIVLPLAVPGGEES